MMRARKILTSLLVTIGLMAGTLPVLATTEAASAATIANLPARWASIASPGTGTTCGLAKNSTIWCWGIAEGPRGVAWDISKGDPAAGTVMDPRQVGTANNWTAVDVAASHACARNSLGELWCWGANANGELGDTTTTSSQVPVKVKSFGKSWNSFSVSNLATCALQTTSLWCWGSNYGGRLLPDSSYDSVVSLPRMYTGSMPITATSEVQLGGTAAIKTGNRVWVRGQSGGYTEILAPLNKSWTQMSVRQNGGTTTGDGPVALESNGSFLSAICLLVSDGTVQCFNRETTTRPFYLGDYTDWTSINIRQDTPREPLCGTRSNGGAPVVTCFSTYGTYTENGRNLDTSSWCNNNTSANNYFFSNGYTIPFANGGWCGQDVLARYFYGTIPNSSSMDLPFNPGSPLASTVGGFYEGSVPGQTSYIAWGRMFALTTDGRVFAVGDGKYGERQDGQPNGTVTDSWAASLTQSPSISSANRTQIPKTGGAQVTLSGSFLVGVTSVSVGSITVPSWTESTDGTSLSFTSPTSITGGTSSITVVTGGGTAILNNAVTFGDSPGAPSITGINPIDGGATINWSAPSSAGSSAITSYTVTASPGGQTCTWTVGPLSCTLTGLTNGTVYRATVRATSDVGPGTTSANSAAFTPYKAPSMPTITTVQAGDTSITVSWSAGNNNGSAISRYDVEAQPGGSSCTTTGTGNTCTITGLSNGTAYTIDVYASNDAGGGDVAIYQNTVTPRTLSGAPTILGINPGDRQLNVNWRAPTSNGGSPVQSYTVTAQPGGVTCTAIAPSTTCNLLGLSNGSVYNVTVVATNPAGDSVASATVSSSPVTIPGKPTISAVEPGANNVLVRWRAPAATGGASVTSYTVVATPGGGTCTTTGAVFNCVISGLENGVTYAFTVTATNSAGVGSASSSYNGVPAAAPGVPRSVVATPLNSGLSVTWAAPSYDGGTSVTGYVATVRSTGDTCTVGAGVFTCTFSAATGASLANGTSYIVDVAALNNAGKSDTTASNNVTPRTTATKPTQVALSPGAGSIRVTWAAPVSDGGSTVTSYVAVASPGSITCTSTGTYCDIVGVTAATSYSVVVYANNAAGAGAQSTPVTAVPFTTPTAPTTVSAVADDGQINVTWAAPTSNGGSDVTGYTVTVSPGGLTCTSPSTSTSCSVRGLTNGTQYTVKVTARNLAGDGAEAVVTGKITPRGAPSATTIRSVDSGDKTLTVKWTALSGSLLNGSPISRYTATASPSGRSCSVDGSNANGVANTTCQITGLVNGVTQTVTVVAINDGGTSAASNAVIRTARSAPSAPTGVIVTPLDQSLSISWNAPIDNGGLLISGYTIQATPVGVAGAAASSCNPNPQSGDSRTCVISNLSNGQSYSVVVHATNDVGDGPDSVAVNATPAGVPTAPTNVKPTISSHQIAVKWTGSNSNGSDIIGYHVTVQPGNYGCDVTDLTFLGCTITDLDNGVPYSISVYATNAAGDSPRGQVNGTATPKAVPNSPASVSVSAAAGQATVGWIPGFDGGSAIKQYLVVASPGGGQCTAAGTATQCVVANLVNGTQYTFSVTAINDAGSSTPAVSTKVLIAGTPNAPVALKVKPADGKITVSFAPPAIDGGNAIVNYKVYVNDELACTVLPAKVLTCEVTDLENGAPQAVRVVANNLVGASASTPEVVVAAGRISDAVTGVIATAGVAGLNVSWTEPYDDGGSPITGYAVTLTPGGKTCKVGPDVTTCDFTGLTIGTTYTAKVVAINGVGSSQPASSQAVKVVGAPTSVRNLSATAGVKSAKLYFAAPSNNGGSTLTNYYFTATTAAGAVIESGPIDASKVKSSYNFTGLTKGVTYTITVTVENDFGMSVAATVTVKSK